MNRINIILEHLIDSAKVEGNEDLELCIQILLGAIDKGMVDELADEMLKFCEKKVLEKQMREN